MSADEEKNENTGTDRPAVDQPVVGPHQREPATEQLTPDIDQTAAHTAPVSEQPVANPLVADAKSVADPAAPRRAGADEAAADTGQADADKDYKVGPGRPPRQFTRKKGQSGNPRGRPCKQRDQKSTLEQVSMRSCGPTRRKPSRGDTRSAMLVLGEAERLGVGDQPPDCLAALPPPPIPVAQTDAIFNTIDLDQLSADEKIELARASKIIDLGGAFTALNAADFAGMKQIIEKGRGKDVTPRA